ncbi:hypothetical protein AAW00_13480 [Aurantiacibacter luteus]|uniref:Uncharacterized protein n=1 Tax=Aurantiacibacter luteus TaxID=1581420 RepID=A0A0G9MPB6_9SPHN|nr:hypothetical protein AAW00_13480 [Aurantiacibacter luteus]
MRIKRAVRAAVQLCGGVDGAGATAGRSRSVAGDWNNRNAAIFPPADCAFALDEACLISGGGLPILSALAAELGAVVIVLPDADAGEDALSGAFVEAAAEFGDVSQRLRDALADGRLESHERAALVAEIDEAQAALARLRHLASGDVVRVAARDGEASHG